MPESRKSRKKGKNNRWSNSFYGGQQDMLVDTREDESKDDLCIDYSYLIKKQISKKEPDIMVVEKLQDMSIQEALIRFNKDQMVIPVDGVESFRLNKRGWLDFDFFTSYQTISERLQTKLQRFGLGFMFPKTIESVDNISGLDEMKVTMRVYHADGGAITLQSKPVLIQARVIDGEQLSYDNCVSASSTMCKRYLLCKTIFNVLVGSPDCYATNARQLTQKDMQLVTKNDMDEIDNAICEHGKGYFWSYIKTKYNIKYTQIIRSHQFVNILYEARKFRINDMEIKRVLKIKARMEIKRKSYGRIRSIAS